MGQRILVCEFDLFRLIGGGQTVYQNIIRKRTNDTFYYFVTQAGTGRDHPPNAIPIPFRRFYDGAPADIPALQDHFFYVYRDAMDMARSLYEAVGQVKLDVVDTPDYRQNGLFLRDALDTHGIPVGIVALALHGALSSAFTLGWPWSDDPKRLFAQMRRREHLQFRVADVRYAVSESYAEQLQRYAPLPVNILDPLTVIRGTQPSFPAPEQRAADLLFIGRRERRKGPDLFLDLAWWLPRDAYRRLIFIGDEGVNHQGTDSRSIVADVSRHRGLTPEFMPSISQSELQTLVRQKSVVLVPSRYDQLNLVALEALLDGCPTVISRHAGVSRFIEERLPGLSWLLIEITCDRAASVPVKEILENYDRKRGDIVEALQRAQLAPDPASLQHIYDSADHYDRRARGIVHDLADRFAMFSVRPAPGLEYDRDANNRNRHSAQVASAPPVETQSSQPVAIAVVGAPPAESVIDAGEPGEIGRVAAPPKEAPSELSQATGAATRNDVIRGLARQIGAVARTSAQLVNWSKSAVRSPRTAIKILLKSRLDSGDMTLFGLDSLAARQAWQLQYQSGVLRNLLTFGERSGAERTAKLKYLADIISERRLDRVRFFREMVRLERLRGNDLIAATYGLRIIRWLGDDRFRLLDFIEDTLKAQGFVREAEAAQAMYGDPQHAAERCRAFLDDQLKRHRVNADRPWEIVDDRRGQKSYQVSIIVSLYNAATKLPTFWKMLQQQSIVRSGEAEIVLVDSGSPANEYRVFQELSALNPLPAVYARSKDRETIQMAWNRGINLSSGAYLAFLGVDEGVHPDCFRILVDQLDRDPSVDWVMADSVVTAVDRTGTFDRDVMLYDRTGYRHDWHYLDCTFLSYVGGLYRRNIHDRLGYYDESFRAAGDTEFKNRILPYIKTKYVAQPLGVFNNYPEERTTQHPRAEIEDLRAWYLHRTPAGASYAFDHRPVDDVVALLKDTLGYRKCYCRHISLDIDLADALATHLALRPDGARWRKTHADAREILHTVQSFELLQHGDNVTFDQLAFVRKFRKMLSLLDNLGQELGIEKHTFDVFHDNRYEQHWWSWST